MIYVYAETALAALDWARRQEWRPRDYRVTGARSPAADGRQFRPDDRIIVVGDLPAEAAETLARNHRKSPDAPAIEYR